MSTGGEESLQKKHLSCLPFEATSTRYRLEQPSTRVVKRRNDSLVRCRLLTLNTESSPDSSGPNPGISPNAFRCWNLTTICLRFVSSASRGLEHPTSDDKQIVASNARILRLVINLISQNEQSTQSPPTTPPPARTPGQHSIWVHGIFQQDFARRCFCFLESMS